MTTVTQQEAIAQIADELQTLLGPEANQLARETGFTKRQSKVSGAVLAQTLVMGWMGNAKASLSELSLTAANVGVMISKQGLDARFTEEAAVFMQKLLEKALQVGMTGPQVEQALLQRFNGIYLLDSTSISLPETLTAVWEGCGGSRGANSCVKVSVLWEMLSGCLTEVELLPGRSHDRQARAASASLPQGALRLADLGYFKLSELARMNDEQVYWLTSHKARTTVMIDGQPIALAAYLQEHGQAGLDCQVELGRTQRVPARLIAYPVSPAALAYRQQRLAEWERKKQCKASEHTRTLLGWHICLTNVDPALLTPYEAVTLLRYRWQIELLFKLWKSEGGLDKWTTQNPWRILCEFYAKLLALLSQHWLLLVGLWRCPDRSPTRAFAVFRRFAWQLGRDLADFDALCATIQHIVVCLQGCRMGKSRAAPRTFQRLAALA